MGLTLPSQPNKASKWSHNRQRLSIAYEDDLGGDFPLFLINRRPERLSPHTGNGAYLSLGSTEDDRNLTLILFMLYLIKVIVITNSMKQGIIMKKAVFMFVLVFLLFLSPLLPQENQMMVIAVRAGIYLDPDLESPIIETVERGTILTLLSAEIIRKDWYYISFYSEEKFLNLTGFVHVSAVEEMHEVPEVKEKEEPEEQMKELEMIEEVLFESPKKIQVLLEKTNIRAEPNFISEIIHQVQLGISLQAVGKSGEWYLVNLPPDEEGIVISGYIHQSFVQEIKARV